jgi:hypothetical protein
MSTCINPLYRQHIKFQILLGDTCLNKNQARKLIIIFGSFSIRNATRRLSEICTASLHIKGYNSRWKTRLLVSNGVLGYISFPRIQYSLLYAAFLITSLVETVLLKHCI